MNRKGRGFGERLGFALQGIVAAARRETSFQIHLLAAAFALLVAFMLHAPPAWIAIVIIMIALVFFAELMNTALEHALDALHPEENQFIRIAKDCAAGAVLVLSVAAVLVFVLMLTDLWMARIN